MSHYLFDSKPGRTVSVNEKTYLFFSGYAYLGMHELAEFTELINEGLDKYGWLFPSSRISNTQLDLYKTCEALLSSITKTEDTVLVSSGFIAGNLATSLWKDEVINLYPSHPAIQRNNKNRLQGSENVIAIDSVNILTAEITDFTSLALHQPGTVIVDDSHGIGLIGSNGGGVCSMLPQNVPASYVCTYSLSKAWNIMAGAVSCSKIVANELRKLPAYTSCTSASPALLYAFMKGQHLYERQRKKLQDNISKFRSLVEKLPQVRSHPQLPVFILPPETDEQQLQDKGIIISSFAYPDPRGKKFLRIVLSALHTEADLEYLAQCLHHILSN